MLNNEELSYIAAHIWFLFTACCVYMLQIPAPILFHLHEGMERVGWRNIRNSNRARSPGQSIGSCGQRSWKRPYILKHNTRQIEENRTRKTLPFVPITGYVRHNTADVQQRRKRTRMSDQLTLEGDLPPTRPPNVLFSFFSTFFFFNLITCLGKHFAVDRASAMVG